MCLELMDLHRGKTLSGSDFSFWDQILNGTNLLAHVSFAAASYTGEDGVYMNSEELLVKKKINLHLVLWWVERQQLWPPSIYFLTHFQMVSSSPCQGTKTTNSLNSPLYFDDLYIYTWL